MKDLLAGVYRHYKGQHYLLIGIASDSNADGFFDSQEEYWFPDGKRTVVVYASLDNVGRTPGPAMHVRTYDDFFAWGHLSMEETVGPRGRVNLWLKPVFEAVEQPHDMVECQRRHVQRFTYVGPTWGVAPA